MNSDMTFYDFMKDAGQSSQFIYTILESFPAGILITDKEDKIIYANLKMTQLTGYSRKELVGKITHTCLHFPDQQERLRKIIEQRSLGIYENYELYIKRKGNKPFLGYTISAPCKDVDGKIAGSILIITDTTLHAREAELKCLAIDATKSLNAVVITDKFGRIEWVNEGFTRLSGFQLYEVIDTKGEVLRREDNNLFTKKLKQVIREKAPVAFECRNYSKSGQQYWVATTLTPVLNNHGGVKEIIITETDITQRKQSEDDLKMQIENQVKTNEIARGNMYKNIQKPVKKIQGLVDRLLRTKMTHAQQECLETIKSTVEILLKSDTNGRR